ncbi:MAG: hypothetical protein J6J11_07360 [Treponema sp.]|nr:hypothetical protein [Treponema sp.]MBQ8668988.1 hypothetical protein [bacterium]
MEINISDLINRLTNYKERVQDDLSQDDDLLLAVVLAVLEEIKNQEEN